MAALVTASMLPTAAATRKLKVLVLHSFGTNATIAEAQWKMSRLPQTVGDLLDVHFCTAPTQCSPETVRNVGLEAVFPESDYGTKHQWWNANDDAPPVYRHKEAALAHVDALLRDASPKFDGIFGFSQGAAMGACVAARLLQPGAAAAEAPSFFWLHAGLPARDAELAALFGDAPLESAGRFRMLVSSCENDRLVKTASTRDLAAKFAGSTFAALPGGSHTYPRFKPTDASLATVRAWLEAQIQIVENKAAGGR